MFSRLTERANIYLRRNMDLIALRISRTARDLASFFSGLDQSFSSAEGSERLILNHLFNVATFFLTAARHSIA